VRLSWGWRTGPSYQKEIDMARSSVIRRATEIADGDEIVLRSPFTEENHDIGVVLEKTTDADDRVILTLVVPHDAALVTRPRPREQVTPFEHSGDLLGDDPDGDIAGYDGPVGASDG
jgi:hypothetical protein